MINLTLNQLKLLVAFHETGSVNETAKRLGVSNEHVRQLLNYLNKKLNNTVVRIYRGDGKPAKLTEAGNAMALKAIEIIKIANEIISISNECKGRVDQGQLF